MAPDGDLLAIETSQGHVVPGLSRPGRRRAGGHALAAEDALVLRKGKSLFLFIHCNGRKRADGLTETAENTVVVMPLRFDAAFDAQVIFFGLQAVIGAARDAYFEFGRKFPSAIAGFTFFCYVLRIDQPRRTDGIALTGRNGAQPGAADAVLYAPFCQFFFYRIDVFQGDKGDFNALPGREMDIPVPIGPGDVADGFQLLDCHLSAYGFQPHGETVFLLLFHEAAFFQFLEICICQCYSSSSMCSGSAVASPSRIRKLRRTGFSSASDRIR